MRAIELHLLLWLTAVTLSSEGEDCQWPKLKLKNEREPVKLGENVTLVCSIDDDDVDTGLMYRWFKDSYSEWRRTQENTIVIPFVTQSDNGNYWCDFTNNPSSAPALCLSNTVTLSIQGFLKVTLRLKDQREPVYIGEDVTLVCSVEGGYTGWTYRWDKGHQTRWKKSNENTVTLSSVTASDSGEYWCGAYREDFPTPVPVSSISNAVTLRVHDLLKATLRLKNPRDPVFVGEDVTLICSIEGGDTGWTYRWYKDNQTGWIKSHEYTISPVTASDSRQYQCEAYRDDHSPVPVSTKSNAVTLRVQVVTTVTTVTTSKSNSGLDTSAIIIIVSLVPALLIFLLGLLLWVYHKKKGLPCLVSKKSRINVNSKEEITVQKEQEDASHHYQSIVEMDPVKKAGQDEVTYSELVHLPQKKKHGTSPVSSSDAGVYSEVRVSDRTRLTN